MNDPVVVESSRIAWTEGRVQGFIPSNIFIKDESANLAHDAEILFLQEFGFRPPAWASIDEHPDAEATPADVYDAGGWRGRWDRLNYVEDWTKEIQPESIEQMFAEARIALRPETAEYQLHLVPSWTSVITYWEYQAELERARDDQEREYLLQKVSFSCGACREQRPLFGEGSWYYHHNDFGFVACEAGYFHHLLNTEARLLPTPSKSKHSAYKLLSGYLEKDNRFVSSRKIVRSHTAYRKLLELGAEMVPFILGDMHYGRIGGIWTLEILAELTGQRGGNPEWWLSWGRVEKYLGRAGD